MSSAAFVSSANSIVHHWRAYLEITKPKVVVLLVFTALVGMALSVPGKLPPRQLLVGLLGSSAMLLHAIRVNLLTAVLTFASLIGYAVVYTVWLEHATPYNIVIGGAAGAMPPVLGWAAITGTALLLGALFLYHTVRLFDDSDKRQPLKTLLFSIDYLKWLFGIMFVDHYLQMI